MEEYGTRTGAMMASADIFTAPIRATKRSSQGTVAASATENEDFFSQFTTLSCWKFHDLHVAMWITILTIFSTMRNHDWDTLGAITFFVETDVFQLIN